jgi:copper transport protein
VSAAIDGEDPGGDLAAVLRHQVTCADCAAWAGAWQGFARRARVASAEQVPDLTDRILAAVAADRAVTRVAARRARQLPTRIALVAVALAQLLSTSPYLIFGRDQAAPEHLARELGSFGVAVSLGLLVAAAWPALAAGSLPVLAASGGLLAITAGLDVAAGRAAAVTELPHLLPSLGVLLLCRLVLTWVPPTDDAAGGARVLWQGLAGRTRSTAGLAVRGLHARGVVRRLGVAVLLAGGLGVAAAVPASAHATLETTTPGSGSVAAAAPTSVRLHFDEPVNVLPGGVKVVGPNGKRVDEGQVSHPQGNGSDVAVGLRGGLARGTYLVAYRIVSADSHPISGAYTFSIGIRTAAADASSIETTSNKPLGWLLGSGRFLTYAGVVLMLGGIVFLLLCWPAGWGTRRAQRLVVGGWVALTVGTLVGLAVKGAYDAGGGFGDIGRLSLVRQLLATPFGKSLGLRVSVLALIVIWWNARTTSARSRAWRVAGGGLAVALLLTFARAGHANAGSGRYLAMASDALHVLAMSVWLGGLAMLALLVLRPSVEDQPAAAVSRFSRVAATSVLVLVATGTYQALRQMDALDELPATTYGRLLLVKLGLVSVVLLAAVASRGFVRTHYRALPVVHASVDDDITVADGRLDSDASAANVSVLRRSVAAEAILATVVLGVTAGLVAAQPAKSAYHPSVDAHVRLGTVNAEISAVPFGDKAMLMHIYTTNAAGAIVTPPEVTATASLPSEQLGPLPVKLRPAGGGHWAATIDVPVRGDWQLKVSARTTEIDVFSKSVKLPIR